MKLVTGANGFLGQAVVAALKEKDIEVRGAVRIAARETDIAVGDIGPDTDWRPALKGIDTVIHTAARVHLMNETSDDPSAAYRHVNVAGTDCLAEQAVQSGVRRLIFVSSIKVNGEATGPGRHKTIFTPFDSPHPEDPYAQSKWDAEQLLRETATRTGLEVVIIRSPLVYGPGVKANFRSLMWAVKRGIPLPLGAVRNRRSMVALDNLADLIVSCIDHPAAANETFLVSDGEDLSTPDLIRRLARAMGAPVRLVPVPVAALMAGASLIGKRKLVERLCDSLQVDISKTRELLDWTPRISVDEGLRRTVSMFATSKNILSM